MKYCTDDGKHIFNTEEEVFDFERKNINKIHLECTVRELVIQTDVWIEPECDRNGNITDFEFINFDSQIYQPDGDWDDLVSFYHCDGENEGMFSNLIHTDKQMAVFINDNYWEPPTFAENYSQGTIHIRMIRKL